MFYVPGIQLFKIVKSPIYTGVGKFPSVLLSE